MRLQNQSIPDCTIIPELGYPDVREAVTWLCRHFGFRERLRIADHRAQLCFDGGALVVAQRRAGAADSAREAVHSTLVRVRDIDVRYRQAQTDGLQIVRVIADHPFGERQFAVMDFGGHTWTFTQTLFDAAPASWGGELVLRKEA